MLQSMKTREKRGTKQERARRFTKWFWIVLAIPAGAFLVLFILVSAGAFGKLPTFEELENPKSNLASELLADDGRVFGAFYVQNRSFVDYKDLSEALVAAVVSTEDERFYTHSGIDFVSLARVAFKTLAMGQKQGGGSTITQQLAKTLFPRDTTQYRSSISRGGRMVVTKLKEWITAVKLEHNYTKEEILTMYFNMVEFSGNNFGIKTAARVFFDKTPGELNIQESAMMVGMVNAPTRYNPTRNYDHALTRRNTVLARMRKNDYITKEQYDILKQTPIETRFTPMSHDEGIATYFREMIRLVMSQPEPKRNQFQTDYDYEFALKRWRENPIYGWCLKNRKPDGTQYNLYRDGLRIYTTLSYNMQVYAEEALLLQMKDIQDKMDAQVKRTGVLFQKTSKADAENIIERAMKQTDRYRSLKKSGAGDSEINKEFNTPTRMRIFTYKGEVDTLMSPRDSILHHKRILRASFMAMDPTSGHVKAYVGGPNFRYFKYDMVSQGKRQLGSTIKPFVYAFAFDQMGLTPCTMVQNLKVTIETHSGEPWTPREASKTEYDGVWHPLKWGLIRSRNNYTAWIMKQAQQPEPVADFINRMGIHSYIYPAVSLVLGPADVTLYELVGAYGTLANKGVFMEPIFITRIEDRQGNVISTFNTTSSDAISDATAYTMLELMQEVVQYGTGHRLRSVYGFTDVAMAGKTGTSQENRDGWFMGVTPRLVGGAWVGGEDQSVHLSVAGEGSVVALPIFGEFMKRIYDDTTLGISRSEKFARPLSARTYNCVNAIEPEEYGRDEFFD